MGKRADGSIQNIACFIALIRLRELHARSLAVQKRLIRNEWKVVPSAHDFEPAGDHEEGIAGSANPTGRA